MRLAHVTDIHDDERIHGWLAKAVKEFDIVTVGGDIGRDVMEGVIDTVKRNENTFLVFGNHDFPLTTGCPRVLHGTKVKYRGLTIGGIGGSLPVGGWPFECDDTEYLILTGNLGKVDILLAHQPPFNTKTDILWSGRHIGSVAVRKYIDEMQPKLTLCVVPGTTILGDNLPIENLTVGCRAVGAHGLNRINKTHKRHYKGDIFTVKGGGILPIQVTKEHPLLAVRKKRTDTKRDGKTINYNVFSEPEWKTPAELKPVTTHDTNGDYLVMPRMAGNTDDVVIQLGSFMKTSVRHRDATTGKFAKVSSHTQLFTIYHGRLKSIPLNKDTAWMIGLYIAEGHKGSNGFFFTLNSNETQIKAKLAQIGLNLGHSAHAVYTPETHSVQIGIHSRPLSRALEKWCGHLAPNKKIPDFILYHNDTSILKSCIEGYRLGDGNTEVGSNGVVKGVRTTSKVLALQLQLAYARLGIVSSIFTSPPHTSMIHGKVVHGKESFRVNFSEVVRWTKSFVQQDRLLVPVRTVTREKHNGMVYNISTTDETFLISNVVSHNCGHIHESQGIEKIGKTLLANPGPFYEDNYFEATVGKRTTGTIHHINRIE